MLTVKKLIDNDSLNNLIQDTLLDFFNNAYGNRESLLVESLSPHKTLESSDDMSDNLRRCTCVVIDSIDRDEAVSIFRSLKITLNLKGHAGYPGGEADEDLGAYDLLIEESALLMLMTKYARDGR